MEDAQLDAFVAAAEDGVDCDGLVAARRSGGDGQNEAAGEYVFAVDGDRRDNLDESTFRSLASDHSSYGGNWYFWERGVPPGDDRVAFLRWLEGTDTTQLPERLDRLESGVHATWGQLHVTVSLDPDGDAGEYSRQYALCHADDVTSDGADLTEYHDPLDARELSKLDEDGRYRPLKTAPTLQRGWHFPDLGPHELVRAVECFYPATIPNWYREGEGDLDIDNWRDTAERQTGIYEVVEELPREAVEWVAQACCVDSQCLKRREWEYDDDEELAAPAGDGEFPCREPCSLVVAAARKWTILEGESERTYEFELTPSEKNQLEELIDAVADGRVDDVREADVGDGANRYRARYLRAKRFDEDGNLCGVETTNGDGE
ncbi:DR2241 family protein [Salinarchaeum laminariae]|uniref:DR2241 family protein n=1 Tax=Salinarchaeum laminariae TaxID=869888 RepID=UPI00207D0AE4|nr:DR2241 family protein [Salinarchaeum laminariae]